MTALIFAAIALYQNGDPSVEVLRDRWGVPTLLAANYEDAVFGLGYMHVRDNVERVALNYKIARGRSGEVMGRNQLLIDGFLRGLEIEERAAAAKISPAAERYVASYLAGANRALAEMRGTPELSSHVPAWVEPFTRTDVLSLTQFVNCAFPLLDLSGALMPGVGSNQFAVAPKRSATGAPILSMDPHLEWNGADGGIVWYEAAMFSPELNFRGVTMPGVPGWIMGHNDHFGWSITNNNPILSVRYTVQRNPEDANQYSHHGEWRPFRNKEVTMRYLDAGELKVQKQTLRLTDWGPMVPLRLESVLLEPLGNFAALEQVPAMMKARNANEFRSAMDHRGLSMWNFVYAGTDGTIGYQYNASVHQRDASFDWTKPVPGNDPKTKLGAMVPLDDLPRVENPTSGLLVQCNNAPWLVPLGNEIKREWPAYIASGGATSRFEILSDLLSSSGKIDPAQARAIATDTTVPYALAAVKRLRKGDADLLKALREWDGHSNIQSKGTVAYAYWISQNPTLGMLAYKAAHDQPWTPEEQAIADSAVDAAAAQMKADGVPYDQEWGDVMRMRRGDREMGVEGWGSPVRNSAAAVNPTGPSRTLAKMSPKIIAGRGSSFRMVVSFEKRGVRSWSILPYGNSHDPESPYYANQMDLFSFGRYKDTLFSLNTTKRWAVQSIKIWR